MKRFLRIMIDEQHITGRESPSFTLPLTNNEIAQLLMITPEHVCRILVEMEKKGLVQRRKGDLIVVDPTSILQKTSH